MPEKRAATSTRVTSARVLTNSEGYKMLRAKKRKGKRSKRLEKKQIKLLKEKLKKGQRKQKKGKKVKDTRKDV